MVNLDEEKVGLGAINKLKSTDPPLFVSSNPDLAYSSRIASQYLFASLKPYSPKCPFNQLLSEGFDVEQIWQQIDLQSLHLLSSVKREIKRFEKNPDQLLNLFGVSKANGVLEREIKENGVVGMEEDSDKFEEFSDEDEDEDEERENGELEQEEEEEDDDESEDGEEFEDDGDGVPEIEDDFLKIKDLEKYMMREEKREYGSEENKKKKKKGGANVDTEDEDTEESEEDDDADELLMYGDGGDDSEDKIRYQDFFVPTKKIPKNSQRKVNKSEDLEMEDVDHSDDAELEDEDDDSDDLKMEDDDDKQNKGNLSTHEKEREKIQAKIKQMEAENLAPKDWTMQGEVSASKRPMDSALEVDLDFEHNIRAPPVITEEVTASLEEIIKKRILEGNFDDVRRAPKLPSTAPKEFKELDDNKSKKGLAEIYEEDYAQQTGFASAPLSFNDELKKEASDLFKRLCLKLDALSHFHFAPKPVVEDMSIQTNVPALAMEEVAPVAVSDAAMLAPEEVFSGKGNIKEENELTKDDRKKRRAKKKRKNKAINAKKAAARTPVKPSETLTEGKEK